MARKAKNPRKTQANNKTTSNGGNVNEFLAGIDNQTRVQDCTAVMELMTEVTKQPAVMWGGSIIGFGSYHYQYDSGREGDMPMVAVSPRKQNLVLYIMPGFEDMQELAAKLGKHKVGKSCLYINKLDDIHIPTLKRMIKKSYQIMQKRYPA